MVQKQNEGVYRAKEGRSYGRDRPLGWPTPLYQVQIEAGGSKVNKAGVQGYNGKDLVRVESDGKGKGKEVSDVVMTKRSRTDFEDQLGEEDDDLLVEEGGLMVDDNDIEEQLGEEARLGPKAKNYLSRPK